VAPPSGRSELERLIDIDSGISAVGEDLYAVTFQGKVARIARENGQVWWSRDLSSYRGLATDDDGVYVSTSDGQVVKIGRRTGVELWRSDKLKNRRLSAPAVIGGQVAVADLKGYVHFFDANTGALTARVKSGGAAVSNPPVVAYDLALFINDKGHLTAYRVAGPRGR
jgi:outer membrane protein assembly factor BamB